MKFIISKFIAVRPQIISSPHKKAMQGNSFNLNSSASHKSNHIISPSNRGTDSIKREELAVSEYLIVHFCCSLKYSFYIYSLLTAQKNSIKKWPI